MTFCASVLISLMVACSVANGPSTTMTESPTAKSIVVICAFAPGPAGLSGVDTNTGREDLLDLGE